MSTNNNFVLSNNKEVKDTLSLMVKNTLEAILSQTNDDGAFSGINPYKLREIINNLDVLPSSGYGFDETLKRVEKDILPHLLKTWSTSYMPHLHSPVLLESICAELIISIFNDSLDSWDQGPAATEIEVKVIQKLCQLFGYGPNSDGVFTSGGSGSNLSATVQARDKYCNEILKHDVKKYGLPDCYKKLRIYTSEISHFSFDKASHILGLGYDAVVHLPVDSKCKIDVKKAEEIIDSDVKAGYLPFLLVATIGTTDFGSIDDVGSLRKICDKYNMSLHCDAAYGSGAIMSSKYKHRLGDLHLADSITIDFHKMFLLPISCSALIVKDKESLDCFALHADYLNREEDEEDGYINLVGKAIQTTRRADALKVYISFATRGRDGYELIINKVIENASYFYNSIKDDPSFICALEPELSSVVFALNGSDDLNKRVRRDLLSNGIVIGQTVKDNRVMLKFTLLNPALDKDKIDYLIKKLKGYLN